MASKSGLEVLPLAMNVIDIVKTVIKLLEALRRAQDRQQDLPRVLQQYQNELQNTQEIVEIILSEDALQIATIRSDLNNIDECGNSLKQKLVEMSEERNAFQQYTHQLLKGSKDTTRLSEIMNDLNLSKDSLILKIQVVHVGLTQAYGNAIEGMRSLLAQTPVAGPLRLAEFPKNRTIQRGANLVCIEFTNLKSLGLCGEADVSLAGAGGRNMNNVARSGITREVIDNTCRGTALMLNGPVGPEPAQHLTIRGNGASGRAFMLNYGTPWEDIKRLDRMQRGRLDSSDFEEDTSDDECRKRRKRKSTKSPIRTLPRRNQRPQPY